MDKQILFVRSEIDSTKALKNRNLVSFHKQQHLSFNQTTLENVDIHPGMYASFHSIDRGKRTIVIEIRTDKISWQKSAWYKITNPQVSITDTAILERLICYTILELYYLVRSSIKCIMILVGII